MRSVQAGVKGLKSRSKEPDAHERHMTSHHSVREEPGRVRLFSARLSAFPPFFLFKSVKSVTAAMSGFDPNPFSADTGENPFDDPSVTQLTSSTITSIDGINTFSETTGSTSPAVLQPSTDPAPKEVAAAAQADLLRRQEQLEKKAAELERREEEINNRIQTGPGLKQNTGLRSRVLPHQPCFHQDFTEEIPPEHQRVCR
uniref:Secretory carrier-associated membrane protein n=1 Tax=Neogobius melanostomus TaxID=47308 RepID=A0A8C6TYJ8_9GOBI